MSDQLSPHVTDQHPPEMSDQHMEQHSLDAEDVQEQAMDHAAHHGADAHAMHGGGVPRPRSPTH